MKLLGAIESLSGDKSAEIKVIDFVISSKVKYAVKLRPLISESDLHLEIRANNNYKEKLQIRA